MRAGRRIKRLSRRLLPVPGATGSSASDAAGGLGELGFQHEGGGDLRGTVISGGRVVDPASGVDAAGDVAVLGGAERVIVRPATDLRSHD